MDGQIAPNETRRVLAAALARQRKAVGASGSPDLAARRDQLMRLRRLLELEAQRLCAAVSADFGVRSPSETLMTDIMLVRAQLELAHRKLPRWMGMRRAPTPFYLWPGGSRILPQPLGVVGVIGAWNYPIGTLLAPAVCALAAGNRVLLKPSEQAPRTAETISELVGRYFEPEFADTVLGGPDVSAEFASLPFDHIVFTGSGAIGRKVALAAAANLVPVTLELGGKCPAIVDASANLDDLVQAFVWGKLVNAGQTCVGVDYLLAPRRLHASIVSALTQRTVSAFPSWPQSPDYTHIISQRHYQRLSDLLNDARKQGATLVPLLPGASPGDRAFPPTIVLDATAEMAVMREEIFGPILPIVACENTEDAIDFINARDKPLALYWFGHDRQVQDAVLRRTFSGGVTINGVVSHVFQRNLGFGGVGPSGIGEYMGETGFRRFSKQKSIFVHGPINALNLLAPPYSERTSKLIRALVRFL